MKINIKNVRIELDIELDTDLETNMKDPITMSLEDAKYLYNQLHELFNGNTAGLQYMPRDSYC